VGRFGADAGTLRTQVAFFVRLAVVAGYLVAFGVCVAAAPVWGPVAVGRYGEACHLYASDTIGPANYRVADIGKPGVPSLDDAQAALVKRIVAVKGDASPLWFAFLPAGKSGGLFIVFDASGFDDQPRPCTYVPLGYPVLNVRCDCYYESGEEAHLRSGDGLARLPKPWLTPLP
jgi:hypothetical protein